VAVAEAEADEVPPLRQLEALAVPVGSMAAEEAEEAGP